MNLYKNATDSINIGIQDIESGDSRRVISGLRNISAGILLLIKEKLRKLSPENSNEVLIKARIVPSFDSSGNLIHIGEGKKTVDLYQMRERCEKLKLNINWKSIEEIVTIRNDAEHYFTVLPSIRIKEALAKSYIVIRTILVDHLDEPLNGALDAHALRVLLSNAEVYQAEKQECVIAMKKIDWQSATLAEAIDETRCSECGSDLVFPNLTKIELCEMTFECKSCANINTFEEIGAAALRAFFAPQGYEVLRDGSESLLTKCPFCHEFSYLMDEKRCALCGESATHRCDLCGSRIPASEISDSNQCSYCENSLSKD